MKSLKNDLKLSYFFDGQLVSYLFNVCSSISNQMRRAIFIFFDLQKKVNKLIDSGINMRGYPTASVYPKIASPVGNCISLSKNSINL
jgi:hypothetical protein